MLHPFLIVSLILGASGAHAQSEASEILTTSPQFLSSGGLTSGVGVPPSAQATPAERTIDGTPPTFVAPIGNPPQAIGGNPPSSGDKQAPIGRPGPGEITPAVQAARSAQ